jgi:hypothetical protein
MAFETQTPFQKQVTFFWANYFGSKSVTSDFSSFNSFSVAVILDLLNSLSGTF